MIQRLLLGSGWKMNKTGREAVEYCNRLIELLDGISGLDRVQLFVVPPFTALDAVKHASRGRFWVGAQNMHWEDWGAFTGEISGPMLRDIGIELVELGHAERRKLFGETDETVGTKVAAALKHGLRPLVCVGEPREDRQAGIQNETISRQLRLAFANLPPEYLSRVLIAYEPAWAIGVGSQAASPVDVALMAAHSRSVLEDMFGPASASIPILYGGTVDAQNCTSLIADGDVDGLFIGRASWDPKGFAAIISNCLKNNIFSKTRDSARASEQA
ncbi:MAG: triose-phosphate isomerase [Bryobacteraceae bacterium]